MDLVTLIISLISGAVGGNVAGAASSPDKNLGTLGNTIAGLIGGGLGDFILKAMGVIASGDMSGLAELDWSTLLATIGVSGASGGALTAVASILKQVLQKK